MAWKHLIKPKKDVGDDSKNWGLHAGPQILSMESEDTPSTKKKSVVQKRKILLKHFAPKMLSMIYKSKLDSLVWQPQCCVLMTFLSPYEGKGKTCTNSRAWSLWPHWPHSPGHRCGDPQFQGHPVFPGIVFPSVGFTLVYKNVSILFL